MRRMAVLVALIALSGAAPSTARAAPSLAKRCVALGVAGGGYVSLSGADGYARTGRRGAAAAFFLEPAGLRSYLLHDRRGVLLTPAGTGTREPGPRAEWARAALTRRYALATARRCRAFPEARVGASGRPHRRTHRDGSIFGFADLHLHITAELRAGGRVIHGKSFDRYGVSRALGGDERDHGADGSADLVGNLLRTGTPDATHDTAGWPAFTGWPVHDTYTHHQTYYRWLERMWRAGLRLAVAQTVEDEPLCRLAPRRSHSCDETATVALQVRRLRALQDHVDAQSGGRGRGWFRLVYEPRQARRVMRRGKLAVVIGMETSSPLCSKLGEDAPRCTRADVSRGVRRIRRLGVRSMFVAHWIDNAFAGPALQPSDNGTLIGFMQRQATGREFGVVPCREGDEGEGRCNARGLTGLGRHLLRRMRSEGMLIEADHLSQRSKRAVLDFARAADYPVVSGHTDTGGEWTPAQLRLLYRLGSLASATPDTAPGLVAKVLRLRRGAGRRRAAVALGTDTGGLAALPGPRRGPGLRPLTYPFRSYDGRLRFTRQRTGRRAFDLNADGVAHYGLFADLLADARRQPGGGRAMATLFRSAEAYVRMWERAVAGGPGGDRALSPVVRLTPRRR